MERTRRGSIILLTTGLALIIQLLIISPALAQDTNTTSAQNDSTIKIVDPKNHTITIIDTRTNQPISVSNFTPTEAVNTTTLPTNAANPTTSEILTPEKPTVNDTLTTNTGNATTNDNLTAKFNALQGK